MQSVAISTTTSRGLPPRPSAYARTVSVAQSPRPTPRCHARKLARTTAGAPPHRCTSGARIVCQAAAAQGYATSEGNLWERYQASSPDYTHLIAVVGFLVVKYGNMVISTYDVLHGLAWLALLQAGITLLAQRSYSDQVSGIIGPAILALWVLRPEQVSMFAAMVGLFGSHFSSKAPGPWWFWTGTLIAALYAGYGSLWITGMYTLMAVWRLKVGMDNGWGLVPFLTSLPTIVVSAWVLLREATVPWSLVLFASQVAYSGMRIAGGLLKSSAGAASI